MVQREPYEKLEQPQAEARRIHSMPDKLKPSPLQHVSSSTGKGTGGTTRKEIPRPKGDRLLPHKKSPQCSPSPHYMKPTTSSDARKERVQIQFSAPKLPPKSCSVKNDSRSPSTCASAAPPVTKSLKTLARKASLRPRRPSMKKISAASVLSPRKSVNRATCSSTMKDYKFPTVLDPNPAAGVEAELTSSKNVCPFDYCSLNGRRHHHLKRLPSVRRRSLKTQRSIQLRRIHSVRKKSFRKGRSITSGKIKSNRGLKISRVVEEAAADDVFVEIYARPPESDLAHRRGKGAELDKEISKILRNLEFVEEDVAYSEEEDEEFNGTMALIEIPEIYSRISFGDNLDQSSDISLDDLCEDASVPASESKQETLACLHDNQVHWIYECCENSCLIDEKEDGLFGDTETESAESSFGVGVDSNLEVSQEDDDERGSFTMDYEGEAPALFACRKVGSSDSYDEIDLSVGLLERDDNVVHGVSASSNIPSQRNDLLHTPEMERSELIDLEESNLALDNSILVEATDGKVGKDSVIGVRERISSQAESLEESDIAAGDGNKDEYVGEKTGNCNSFEREKSEAGENDEREQDLTIDADVGDGVVEGNKIDAFRSEESEVSIRDECSENISLNENESGKSEAKSQNVIRDLTQSKSATDDGSQNINLDGKDDEYSLNVFGGEESEQDHKQSDFGTDDESPDNVSFSNVADETETRGKKGDNCNGYNSNTSDQEDYEESKASKDDEDPDNINLDADDNDEAGCDAAKGGNTICIANERSEQYLEESELSADDKRSENINSSNSLNETSEEDEYEGSELSTCDENRYKNLRVSTEDKIEAGKRTDRYLSIDLIETNSEYNQMSANGQLEHTDLSDNGISSDNLTTLENGKTTCNEEVGCILTPKVYNKQKSRRRSFNRRRNFEMEMVRLINPRAPCFLPLNTKPNGEKVDLRHQEMDEDKNPEDWMTDCALQKLVKKLAPARKRKVALLVEAFEAVVPNSSLTSSTSGLGKPIQACS